MVQAAGGAVMHFGPLISLNPTAYLSIVADHVHPIMTTGYP